MLEAVIFDLDGTIGNTLPLCISSFKKSIEPFVGRPISDEEIIATFGPSEEGTIAALAPDNFDEAMDGYIKVYTEQHDMVEAPFAGIVPIFKWVEEHNLKLGLITGKGPLSCDITLDEFGIRDYFDSVRTGWQQGPRKVIDMNEMLEEWGIQPENAIYIGDSPSDVTSSELAGVTPVSAAWDELADVNTLREMNPDRTFTSVAAFKTYLEGLI